MKQKKRKKMKNRIMLICITFSIVLCGCIACIGYNTYRVNILERYQVYAGTLLEVASSHFDGDDIQECIRTLQCSEKYQQTRLELDRLKVHSEISYIYVLYFPDRENPRQANFVMNGTTALERERQQEKEVLSALGEDSLDSFNMEMKKEFRDAVYGDVETKGYIVNNTHEYGYQMTGYTVIQNTKGEGICVLAIDLPMVQINQTINIYLMIVSTCGALLLLLFLAVLLKMLNRSVIYPIQEIAHSAKDFVEQTMSNPEDPSALSYQQVKVDTGDEIEILSDSLVNMTNELKTYMGNLKYITAEKERIGAELDVAENIQANMLPCIFPAFPERQEFDIYATMTPAKEVGGDFYDFFLVDDDKLALAMADVSGKGIPAALFMVIAKTLIKNVAQTGISPKAVLEKVNTQLCVNNSAEMFVTVWLGILEISTGKMLCANAGHEYPVLKRVDGDFELVKDKHGFVLAGMENSHYREYELQLNPGDRMFLYTDGVAEATDGEDRLYGTDRMLAALNRNKDTNSERLLRAMKEDIDAFVGTAPQFDDITMLSLDLMHLSDNGMKKLKIHPSLAAMDEVSTFVEQELERAGVSGKEIAQMNIAVDEIFSNIVQYSGATVFTVSAGIVNGCITLRFADNGLPYDPTAKSDPDISLSAEERSIGGLGIYMVKKSMDTVCYEYHDGLNILVLTKQTDKRR